MIGKAAAMGQIVQLNLHLSHLLVVILRTLAHLTLVASNSMQAATMAVAVIAKI